MSRMQVGFNLEVGGYFSIKRNAVSFWGDTWVRQEQVVAYCKALLEVFRCGPCSLKTLTRQLPVAALLAGAWAAHTCRLPSGATTHRRSSS